MKLANGNQALWRSEYPFASHEFSLDGLRYHFLDEGVGPPLLMVHGNPTWSFYWRNLVRGLSDRFRCVVPDHIGCGLSEKPQDYSYTLDQHIQNLVQFVEHVDLRGATLLAHDWGGAIGLGTVLKLPERFSRLVLFNTAAFPPPFFPWRIRVCRTPIVGRWAMRGLNVFPRAALTMAVEKTERMTAPIRAGFLAPYDNWANRVAVDHFVGDIPTNPRQATWQTLANIEQSLPSLADRKIALIWGMKDWCFRPECLTRFRASFPRAEVHELADAGHYVLEDAHERIVPILREFLS